MHYRQAAAGGGARTVSELNAGVVSACGLQAWQIDIRRASRDRPDAIVVQRSPTMSARDNACIAQVIGRSRFYVDR